MFNDNWTPADTTSKRLIAADEAHPVLWVWMLEALLEGDWVRLERMERLDKALAKP